MCLLFLLQMGALFVSGAVADTQAAGLQALDQKDYARAEQIFSELAAADSKDYSAFFNLALAETALKKDDQAAAHFKQVLALKPGLYEAELDLGMLDLRDRDPAGAVPLLQDAAKQKTNQARPRRYLGDALLAQGDFNGAAEAYQSALTIDPKLGAAELGLGQSLLRQNKLDDALPHYQLAAALDSNLKSYLLEIAGGLMASKEQDKAVELLKEFPQDPGAREELGRLYLEMKRPADAVPEFQAAVELSPTPANKVALASAYVQNNQEELAAPILEQALAANPNDFDLRMVVGRIHRDKRDKHEYALAADEFLAAANLKPDSVVAWNEAVSALVLSEQYTQALAALDRVHNLNADNAGDLYYRAMVLDKLHEVKPALAAYRNFLQASQGKFPDQEFIARQRSRILEKEANR